MKNSKAVKKEEDDKSKASNRRLKGVVCHVPMSFYHIFRTYKLCLFNFFYKLVVTEILHGGWAIKQNQVKHINGSLISEDVKTKIYHILSKKLCLICTLLSKNQKEVI